VPPSLRFASKVLPRAARALPISIFWIVQLSGENIERLDCRERTVTSAIIQEGCFMFEAASVITNPITLCALVFSIVWKFAATKWSGRGRKASNIRKLAFSMAVVIPVASLFLAWRQIENSVPVKSAGFSKSSAEGSSSPPAPSTAKPLPRPNSIQTSFGSQSPNVSGVAGDVDIRFGASGGVKKSTTGTTK
jgi:hypothetical protein